MRHLLILALVLGLTACGENARGGAGGGGDGGGGGSDVPRPQRIKCTEIVAVAVEVGGFSVFKYEAARPNATADSAGCTPIEEDDEDSPAKCVDEKLPACSEPGLMPWTYVTRAQASESCERSGYRLCTEKEWLLACGGVDHLHFPYGQVVHQGYCNGHKGGSGLEASGSREKCVSDFGAVDILGNAWEWIADDGRGGEGRYLGYSYKVTGVRPTADGMCDKGLQTGQETFDRLDVGFRCCKDLEG